jgi:hypothetical protein
MQARRRALAGAALAVAFVSACLVAAPRSGAAPGASISYAAPTASWSSSAPMTGSATTQRNDTCAVPTHPCDDVTLTVDRGGDTQAKLLFELAPSAGAEMEITVYPPGCPSDVEAPHLQFPACASYYAGTHGAFVGPVNGAYLIRMACASCAASTYEAKATLLHFTADVPPPGDQSFRWAVQQLPKKPSGLTQYGEPNIAINRLGHAIASTFGPTAWISTDDGHTWGPPIDTIDKVCASAPADADTAVSDDDTYYAVNLCLAGLTNLSYASHDGGKTWNSGKGGLPTPPGEEADADRQWYAVDPSDPAVLYLSYHDLEGPNIWVVKSTDHGETWPQQVPVTLTSSNAVEVATGALAARPVVDPTDPRTVLVFYSSGPATDMPEEEGFPYPYLSFARSTDGGLTWGENVLVHDAGSTGGLVNTVAYIFPVAAMDSAGNAYTVLSQRNGGEKETHLYLLVVPKGSTGRARAVRIDQGGLRSNVLPWIVAGDPGRVAVSWYGSKAADVRDTSAQWSEMVAVSTDALSGTPHFAQSRVSGESPMHVADICTFGSGCGGDRNLYDFQTIAVDPCGYVQMVWTDDAHDYGVTMHARQTAGPSLRAAGCPAGFDVAKGGFVGGTGPGSGSGAASGRGRLPATGEQPWRAATAAALAVAVGALATGRAAWGCGPGRGRGRRRRTRRTAGGGGPAGT